MLKPNSPLLAQIAMNPLLVDERAQELFQTCLQHVISHDKAEALVDAAQMASSDDEDFWPTDENDWRMDYRPYTVIDGVLQIPVMGVLLSRFPWQLGRWATGYKYIEMAIRRGLDDPAVLGIAFIEDSPGGEVTECFELGDKIYDWRGQKPIRSFAANHAYSAAYLIYCSADQGQHVVTRSGGVGSIGVVTAHVEYSEYMKNEGIKVTFIFAGAHKVDGNPYEKLSPSAKARTQKRIDKIYGVFTSTVARNTGIEEDKIRATEALTYDADEAIEVGLADRIGALEEELVVYATELAETGDEFMAVQDNVTGKKVGGGDEATTYTQEQVDALVATAKAEGMTAGASAEQTRYTEIMGCDEAKTRPAAAAMMVELNVDAATAKTKLAKMPEEVSAKVEDKGGDKANDNGGKKTMSHFEEHMNKTKHPDINANAGEGGDNGEDDSAAATNSILASFGAAAGLSRKKAS